MQTHYAHTSFPYPLVHTHPDPLPARWRHPILLGILLLTLVVSALYALLTPPWQVPDEPAHVNYALHVARTGTLPVLQAGDYDAAYLEAIKAAGFPPEMPVTPIRYESHQPPLYYLVGAVLLRILLPHTLAGAPSWELSTQAMYLLRFFSLLLGLSTLILTYLTVRRLFPAHPSLALAATAFVAFIPQHVAMMAGANNDALAEFLLAFLLWRLVILATAGRGGQGLPLPFALILLTKTTVYLPALFAILTLYALLALQAHRDGQPARVLRPLVWTLVPALLIALPFYVRNLVVYGWPDILGLRRHAAVVVGQTTAAEYIAQNGWGAYWARAMTWTFRSFWGQFGWMGVLMDVRVYRGLAYFSLILALAASLFFVCGLRDRHWGLVVRRSPTYMCLSPAQHNAIGALLAAGVGTWVAYVGYNLSFLQHQGRYLFTGLIPLATLVIPGLWMLLTAPWSRRLALAAGGSAFLALMGAVLDLGPVDRWDVLVLLAITAWYFLASRFPRARPLWLLAPLLALAGVAAGALFWFIIPALAR